MVTLEEIKDEVAIDEGYKDWDDLLDACAGGLDMYHKEIMDEVAKLYATEAIKSDRERVSKKAKISFHCGTTKITHSISYYQSGADNMQVDKQSILNLPIELP